MERVLLTSHLRLSASPPSRMMMLAVLAAASALMSVHSTSAPRRAKASAVSRPMPEPAPVTTTRLPLSGPFGCVPVTSLRCSGPLAGAPSMC